MAKGKGKKAEGAESQPSNAGATVVGVEPDGSVSLRFYLSDNSQAVAMAVGGGSTAENTKVRDSLVAAIEATLQATTMKDVPSAD